MKESARYILQILVFVSLVLSVGTGGYMIIEDGLTVSDAFYMTVTAITPTQFDEVHELSVPGRYFTVVLVFCGFGAVVAFATQFARWVIQSELEGVGVITRKQMRRRISRMKNHYIVCGYGKIGGAICSELRQQQLPFVVITNDETSVAAIHREGYALVRGNPTADLSLKEAEVERAYGVIAVLTDDSDNLFISLAARELNPKIFIIARGEDLGVEDRILRAGADIVVSPMKLGGRQIAELIKQQANESAELAGSAAPASLLGLHLSAYRHASNDPITVADVLEESRAVGAAGIERCDGSFESTPPADTPLHQGDALVMIRRAEETGDSVPRRTTGKTILLADDHRALRLLFARKLAAAGHDVLQAASGDDALALARAHAPDLIVLDVNMPHRNGYEVCETLRQSEPLADVPIILYSGEDTAEFAQRGRAAGADVCVRKTSKSSELLASIEEIFAQRNATDNGRELRSAAFDVEIAMKNTEGDRTLLREVVSAMLVETPQLMDRIKTAVRQLDHRAVRLAAHALKSSLAIVGAQEASAVAARLESAGSDADMENAARLQAELEPRIDALMRSLEDHVGQPHDS